MTYTVSGGALNSAQPQPVNCINVHSLLTVSMNLSDSSITCVHIERASKWPAAAWCAVERGDEQAQAGLP